MKKMILILMIACVLLSGCTEAEKPVYGKGNPPAEYQELFGNDNSARLDFMQNRAIEQLSKRIARLEAVDLEFGTVNRWVVDPNEVTE